MVQVQPFTYEAKLQSTQTSSHRKNTAISKAIDNFEPVYFLNWYGTSFPIMSQFWTVLP